MHNVCDYWFNKDQNRIRDIRPDTLSQMLAMANVLPGGRYLAVDDASGLVAAAILERMGGTKEQCGFDGSIFDLLLRFRDSAYSL